MTTGYSRVVGWYQGDPIPARVTPDCDYCGEDGGCYFCGICPVAAGVHRGDKGGFLAPVNHTVTYWDGQQVIGAAPQVGSSIFYDKKPESVGWVCKRCVLNAERGLPL